MHSLTLNPVADIAPFLGEGEVVAFGYLLFKIEPDEQPRLLQRVAVKLSARCGPVRAVGRGDAIWFLSAGQIYRLGIDAVVATQR